MTSSINYVMISAYLLYSIRQTFYLVQTERHYREINILVNKDPTPPSVPENYRRNFQRTIEKPTKRVVGDSSYLN